MGKSMKEYQDALIIMQEKSTFDSKGNKLVKIAVRTEDSEFKQLLNEFITACHSYFKLGYSRAVKSETLPNNRTEWFPFYEERKKNLKTYINEILSTQKPQWQILAERAGWKENICEQK